MDFSDILVIFLIFYTADLNGDLTKAKQENKELQQKITECAR